MKVLFVCSGNSEFGIIPFIKSQGESIKKNGIDVEYFTIQGKGFLGYLKNVILLKKHLREKECDVIHAHYALCGWVSVLAVPCKPVIVSFMGDDLYGSVSNRGKRKLSSYLNIILSQLLQPFLSKIIVKSKNLEKYVYLKRKVSIIPNGVNFNQFKPIDINYSRDMTKLSQDYKYILFLGEPLNRRKNVTLLEKAIEIINNSNVKTINPYPVSHDAVAWYLNAADVFVITSYLEGSPNVIKEAMACNCPIVSTNVGDVKEVIGNTEGCYITSYDPEDVAKKIKKAIAFGKRTSGRNSIQHLESSVIADKIIDVYKKVLS